MSKFVLQTSSPAENCFKEFFLYDPVSILSAPYTAFTSEQKEACTQVCVTNPDRACCDQKCIFEVTNIYRDKKFYFENFSKLYSNFFQLEKENEEMWLAIIEDSIKTCKIISNNNFTYQSLYYTFKLFSAFLSVDAETTNELYYGVPSISYTFLHCIDQQNFLNCPDLIYEANIDSYEEVKKYFETKKETGECGEVINGFYIIDNAFWKRRTTDYIE